MKRRAFGLSLAALATARGAIAADPLLKQPVKLVVPASPGGFTDVAARMLADRLASRIGQAVVVDNRAGASGIIGAEVVAHAAPDGSTLMVGTIQSHATNVPLFPKLSYDPVKDFVPVSRLAMGYTVLVVPASSPYRSLQALLDAARAQPGKLTYGSAGAGSSSHLCAEMMRQAANVDVLHVPFKGTTPALQALMGGQISMLFDTVPSSLPHVKSGALRALAVSSSQRLSSLGDVPAVAELLPGFEMAVWVGLYAPAATPPALIEALSREVNAILRESTLAQKFEQLGFEPAPQSPAEFGTFTRAEIAKWTRVVRTGKITVE